MPSRPPAAARPRATTARVRDGKLYRTQNDQAPITVGSADWDAWITPTKNFYVELPGNDGFAVRHNGRFWFAYITVTGKRITHYIGAALSADVLAEAATKLRERRNLLITPEERLQDAVQPLLGDLFPQAGVGAKYRILIERIDGNGKPITGENRLDVTISSE